MPLCGAQLIGIPAFQESFFERNNSIPGKPTVPTVGAVSARNRRYKQVLLSTGMTTSSALAFRYP
jgi:hypothetical protein